MRSVMQIQGWGRYPRLEANVIKPLTYSASQHCVTDNNLTLIARGMGRSYGDSSLFRNVMDTGHLNFLLGFDFNNGMLHCEAGVTLADILAVFVPQGWFLPVSPGTKFVTVGGAIASDVHGKNHHQVGCFSEFVHSFKLLLADGDIVTCSRTQNMDLFYATCGGMGLTGIILEATIQLKPIKSSYIEETLYKVENLAEALDVLEQSKHYTYSVAWIDCLATKNALGRSIIMLGEHAADGQLSLNTKYHLSVPCDMPNFLLNPIFVKSFNALYYKRVKNKMSKRQVHYETFFYPLDTILHWNRLYGKNGFIQYQFVIPKSAGLVGMTNILKKIAATNRGSFLAVLKTLGKENANLLSFPMEGYTLALDIKIDNSLFKILDELDAMVLTYGGRLYLTKDARMSEHTFKQSYKRWEAMQAVRAKYKALGKFKSLQSQRLGLD